MSKIPNPPPSQISSEELEQIFKNSGFIEEFYFPPEVPKPPSSFQEKKFTKDKTMTVEKEKD